MTDLPSPPLWLQGGTYAADDDRALLRALVGSEGIVAAADLAVSANGTPNMSVNVAAGRAFVQRTSATDFYLLENDATVNLTIAASDATNARKDIVVARVYDAAYSGADNKATLEVVTGAPSATPAEPAVPANALKLAVVNVAAGATSVSAANITDSRVVAVPSFGQSVTDALPKGVVAEQTLAANYGPGAGPITLNTVTPTLLAGRRYRVSANADVIRASAGESSAIIIARNGGNLGVRSATSVVAGAAETISAFATLDGDGAAQDITVQVVRAGGASNISGGGSILIVEDIGPA